MSWTPNQMPPQDGRVAVVTGANSGIGFHATQQLARHGAHVVLACRNEKKARDAMAKIRADIPAASLSFVPLDLSSQKSVRDAATLIRRQQPKIDLLLNNAGLMWLEQGLTEDGFEQQIGTNHFGHFTLTLQLLERMVTVPGSRIVTVSSIAHRGGRIHFDNLTLKGEYGRQKAYAQSKLANLMFAIELDRRLQRAGGQTQSLARHCRAEPHEDRQDRRLDLAAIYPERRERRLADPVCGHLGGCRRRPVLRPERLVRSHGRTGPGPRPPLCPGPGQRPAPVAVVRAAHRRAVSTRVSCRHWTDSRRAGN